MLKNNKLSEHYLHGDLLNAIQVSLSALGKTVDSVTLDDLAPVDEFHVGGRAATEHFLAQLKFKAPDHVLDIGCGLGGAARFVANSYHCSVAGIDLAEEYIEVGKTLCEWVKLDELIHLQQASALAMPFKKSTFDGAYMMHVGMNIKDKRKLFSEVHRVLCAESFFGIYDIMQLTEGKLTYPVPWASEAKMSHLATLEQYQQALQEAGFELVTQNNRHDFAVSFFQKIRAASKTNDGPPPLGLHTLMKETTGEKIKHMIEGISSMQIAPVELIAYKP